MASRLQSGRTTSYKENQVTGGVYKRSPLADGERVGKRETGRFSRSRQMVNVLREEFLYSEKRARDLLFQEMKASLEKCGSPVILARLGREAASAARQRALNVGYEFYKWQTASKATINAMLRAGVLLATDGDPIRLNIAAQAAKVAALAEGFEDITEAYLLEVLIRRLGDVTPRDHIALAHALFRQFDRSVLMEDLEDRVVMLLATLSDRVGICADLTYTPIAQNWRDCA
jgi:hypothetical protein